MPLVSALATVVMAVQSLGGSVAGTVTDGESGEPLADALVSLVDVERAVLSDSAGRYVFRDVSPGPQHLAVERIGYAERSLHALVPRDGTVSIHVALRPEPVELDEVEVDVRPLVPVRGLESGDPAAYPDRGLSLAAVRDHPLLSEPDVLQALGGGEVTLRPESPSGLHVRGGASDQITYLLDGIPVLSPYHGAATFSAWNPDALSRIDLLSAAPPPGAPESLSGVVAATTRTPGPALQTYGAVSTTQARVTVDGPLGDGGAGYLLSWRTGFPGFPSTEADPSYLAGENGDWLAKLELPLPRGHLRLLGFDSESEISAAATSSDDEADDPARNVFEWTSRSLGAEWRGDLGGAALGLRAWSARGEAEAFWTGGDPTSLETLTAERRDEGVAADVELTAERSTTAAGVRAERRRTHYHLNAPAGSGASLLDRSLPVAAAFVEHARVLSPEARLDVALVSSLAGGDLHWSPRARLRWWPSAAVTLTGSVARLHQFAQSFRNPESFVSNVFPADLYVGSGGSDVPVARTDQAIVAVEARPLAGLRLGVQGYARDFDGLVLVAPRDADPFTAGEFATGGGRARGLAVEAAAHTARVALLLSYGLHDVRYRYDESDYVPDHGATHALEGGVVVFPSTTSSVRLGAVSLLGRRGTAVLGGVEWEACNLLDQGCEFAGSPRHVLDDLGGAPLPAYVRVDLGVAKHWHVELAGRDGLVSVFGTVSNLLDRRNVLAFAEDPVTGELVEITMRPRSPLVVGLDWRF